MGKEVGEMKGKARGEAETKKLRLTPFRSNERYQDQNNMEDSTKRGHKVDDRRRDEEVGDNDGDGERAADPPVDRLVQHEGNDIQNRQNQEYLLSKVTTSIFHNWRRIERKGK